MTTTVVTQLAVLLGDTVDHARYIWREGERLTKYPGARMWCDGLRKEAREADPALST